MGDAIGDYLTDEKVDARVCYEEMLSEVESWIDYHRKYLTKAETLKELMLGNRPAQLETLLDWIDDRYFVNGLRESLTTGKG